MPAGRRGEGTSEGENKKVKRYEGKRYRPSSIALTKSYGKRGEFNMLTYKKRREEGRNRKKGAEKECSS